MKFNAGSSALVYFPYFYPVNVSFGEGQQMLVMVEFAVECSWFGSVELEVNTCPGVPIALSADFVSHSSGRSFQSSGVSPAAIPFGIDA